jgi:hypothetical protein
VTRLLAAALAALLSLAAVTGTGAFETGIADRSAAVAVASDADAYLGVATTDVSLTNSRHDGVEVLVLTNRFPDDLTHVRVEVVDGGDGPPKLLDATAPTALDAGASVVVGATIVCGGAATETWPVRIVVTGPGLRVELDRAVTVGCSGEPPGGGPPDGGPGGPPAEGPGGPPDDVPRGPPGDVPGTSSADGPRGPSGAPGAEPLSPTAAAETRTPGPPATGGVG